MHIRIQTPLTVVWKTLMPINTDGAARVSQWLFIVIINLIRNYMHNCAYIENRILIFSGCVYERFLPVAVFRLRVRAHTLLM